MAQGHEGARRYIEQLIEVIISAEVADHVQALDNIRIDPFIGLREHGGQTQIVDLIVVRELDALIGERGSGGLE